MKYGSAIFCSTCVISVLLLAQCARNDDNNNNAQAGPGVKQPTNVPVSIPLVTTVTPDYRS